MKKMLPVLALILSSSSFAQNIDTLAFQDFETVPQAPVWNYTGTLSDVQSGYASAASCIPGTPLGIGGSQAWHVVSVSGGNAITFDNVSIPGVYDSIQVNFRLAGLSLTSSTGGPDNLDYVLVEYSTDNGATWVQRLRIRGAINNNSFWAYDATGVAAVQSTPTVETVFQPVNSGLNVAEGYSFCQITFPGNTSQLSVRITPRSSSSSDSWLVDNLVMRGFSTCTPSFASITESTCDSYTSPAGNIYAATGNYIDTIANTSGCDSIIDIDLTITNSTSYTDVQAACGSYTWMDGNTYSASTNTPTFTLTNAAGCDSIITLDLTVNPIPDNNVIQSGTLLTADQFGATYQWLDCDNNYAVINGATSQTFTPQNTGNYAVEVMLNGCSDTSTCYLVDYTGINELQVGEKTLVKIVDLTGRETTPTKNTVLIYVYSDGTTERIYNYE